MKPAEGSFIRISYKMTTRVRCSILLLFILPARNDDSYKYNMKFYNQL